MNIRIQLLVYLFAALLIFPACNASKTAKGAAIGGAAGGAVGGAIGKAAGNTAAGIIIGATVGGTAGALIGRKMDKQAKEMQRDLEGAEVERVGEGILITFDSGLLFDLDSYDLRAETKENLSNLAITLKKYPDTEIVIQGHTDSQGTEDYNLELSKKRANSVNKYLILQNVDSERITTMGMGENNPVESNKTAAGRQANRRVEVAIFANDDMKKAAKRGDL